jgi:hypothetical protein
MGDPPERIMQQLGEVSAKYAEAQRNAQKAMGLYKEARDENEELKSNFNTLKQAYQALQGRFRESQSAHTSAQQEVFHSIAYNPRKKGIRINEGMQTRIFLKTMSPT